MSDEYRSQESSKRPSWIWIIAGLGVLVLGFVIMTLAGAANAPEEGAVAREDSIPYVETVQAEQAGYRACGALEFVRLGAASRNRVLDRVCARLESEALKDVRGTGIGDRQALISGCRCIDSSTGVPYRSPSGSAP